MTYSAIVTSALAFAGFDKSAQTPLRDLSPAGEVYDRYGLPALVGAAAGGVTGAVLPSKGHRIRNALLGALAGGTVGVGFRAAEAANDLMHQPDKRTASPASSGASTSAHPISSRLAGSLAPPALTAAEGRMGAAYFNPSKGLSPEQMTQNDELFAKAKGLGINVKNEKLGPHNAAYHPAEHTIYAAPGIRPEAVAHEMGHATGAKGLIKVAPLLSRSAAPLLGIGSMVVNDKDTSRNLAIAGSLASAPLVAEELRASINAAKFLRPGQRMGPFRGLPGYLLQALSPLAAYGIRDRMGGFAAPTLANPPSTPQSP